MDEVEDERGTKSLGLRRGLWGRMLGIGLFVALGTFAVSQAIEGDRGQVAAAADEALSETTGTTASEQSIPADGASDQHVALQQAASDPSKFVDSAALVTAIDAGNRDQQANGPQPTNSQQFSLSPNKNLTLPNETARSTEKSRLVATTLQPQATATGRSGGNQDTRSENSTDNSAFAPPPTDPSAGPKPLVSLPIEKPEQLASPNDANQQSKEQGFGTPPSRSFDSQELPSKSFEPQKNPPSGDFATASPSVASPSRFDSGPMGFAASPQTNSDSAAAPVTKADNSSNGALSIGGLKPQDNKATAENPGGGFPGNDLRSPASINSNQANAPTSDQGFASGQTNTTGADFTPSTATTNPSLPKLPATSTDERSAFSSPTTNSNPSAVPVPPSVTGQGGSSTPPADNGTRFGSPPGGMPAREEQPAAAPPPSSLPNPFAERPVTPDPRSPSGGFGSSTAPSPQQPAARSPLTQLPALGGNQNPPVNAASAAQTRPVPGDAKLEGLQTPSLAIEKISPDEIQLGQVAKFKIAVKNVGRVLATGVNVSDQIPAGADLVTSVPEPSQKSADGKIQWSLGDLAPGEEKIISLDLRPNRPGEIGSVAQVTFASQASSRTRVTRPVLAVEHSGPPRILVGDLVPLKIVIHNRGDGVAKDVVVQEAVPLQLKFNDEFRDLEYPIGDIPPGQSREINLNLVAVEAGRFQNLVAVKGKGDIEAEHKIEMEVIAPKLEANSSGPSRRFLKRAATHTFTASNSGTAAATNVDLIARLPRGVQFNSANNQGQYDPGSHAVYWSLADLKPGQSANVELVSTPVETGQHEIEFRATADLNQTASFKQALNIEHLVDVYFEIDDLDDHIEIGANTRYQVRIVNQGTKPATNVRLALELDNGIRPDSVDSRIPAEIRGQAVVFQPIASINPGEELRLIVVATAMAAGEHRAAANLQTDGREINITKEESTRVYSDR